MIASPCIQRCSLEADHSFCSGCLRSLDEILIWPHADDARKECILSAIARRRQALPRNERQAP